MTNHLFQPDPDCTDYCKCGSHKEHHVADEQMSARSQTITGKRESQGGAGEAPEGEHVRLIVRSRTETEAQWKARGDAFGEVLDLIGDSDQSWEWLIDRVTQKRDQAIAFEQSYKADRQEASN